MRVVVHIFEFTVYRCVDTDNTFEPFRMNYIKLIDLIIWRQNHYAILLNADELGECDRCVPFPFQV